MAAPEPGVKGRVTELGPYTTLGVGGPAELWKVESEADLREATREAFRVIGAGSNLLISDAGVADRVVKLGRSYNDIKRFDGQTDIWLGAATPLPGLVRRAAEAGLSGLEGLLGIPANLGGAVAMNAGTRFGEMSDTLKEVEVFIGGASERLDAAELKMSYRHSELPEGAVITRVRLGLTPSDKARVQERMAAVDEARKGQPKVKSAGCAFKNPPRDSAGRLIDIHGLKGSRVGQAMVSQEHGNFFVNLGGATAEDMLGLIALVRAGVDVPLELEWQLWGFEATP